MGLFGIFSGKPPESHEHRGDEYMSSGAFGDARIEYEKALDKIEKRFPEKVHLKDRLGEKMRSAGNGLAKNHLENAEAMATAGEVADAQELCQLALDLVDDNGLKAEIEKRLAGLFGNDAFRAAQPQIYDYAANEPDDVAGHEEDDLHDEEIFGVLCNALPEDLQEAYHSYGKSFISGYIALNEGDFEAAADHLENAMAENSAPNLIPLELATAYIHLHAYDEAVDLLESFVASNPEQPRAYQLLCEIYWEKNDYDRASRLLSKIPESIKQSRAMLILQGENSFQKKDYAAAESVFDQYVTLFGKDDIVSRALAKTFEMSGRTGEAKSLYADIINKCHSCGTRADPFLKRRYAELCYQDGDTSANLLEIYLGLAREDPDNRAAYFSRISRIFHSKGEPQEAMRYEALAKNTES